MKIPANKLNIIFTCDECDETCEWPVSKLDDGTPQCPECDRDMRVSEEVSYDEPMVLSIELDVSSGLLLAVKHILDEQSTSEIVMKKFELSAHQAAEAVTQANAIRSWVRTGLELLYNERWYDRKRDKLPKEG